LNIDGAKDQAFPSLADLAGLTTNAVTRSPDTVNAFTCSKNENRDSSAKHRIDNIHWHGSLGQALAARISQITPIWADVIRKKLPTHSFDGDRFPLCNSSWL